MLNKHQKLYSPHFRKTLMAVALSGLSSITFALNVNTSSVDELASGLNGVGPKLASAIVQYREANGPFTSEQDFMQVSGIGPVIVERNRSQLEFDAPSQ